MLPRGLCDDVQQVIAKFLWGTKEDKHRIHWQKWEKLSHAKNRGGMGLENLLASTKPW